MKRVAVYTASRNLYKPMLGPIKSMLKNGNPDEIYLLVEDDQMPYWLPENVKVINVSHQTFFPKDGPNMKSKYTYLALMRAALAYVLPSDVDVVLSMDCDTLVVGDITELWERDMTGYYFSASIEPHRTRWETLYTNIGVCLFNLKMLRETGMVDKVIKELNTNKYPNVEQDVFNYLCQGHILPMPSDYNRNDYTMKPMEERIRHYAGHSTWTSAYDVVNWGNVVWERILHG